MIGLSVELIISWLLLWFFERKSLLALGIIPTKKWLLSENQLMLTDKEQASPIKFVPLILNYFLCQFHY